MNILKTLNHFLITRYVYSLLIPSILSKKYLEYLLSQNHGQIIYDFTLNQRHATNGDYVGPDDKDCLGTDRGLLLANKSSELKLPMNILSNKIEIMPLPYQMIFWMNILSGPGTIAFRWSEYSFWNLFLEDTNYVNFCFYNQNFGKRISNFGEIHFGSWTFFSIHFLKVRLNCILTIIYNYHYY